MSDNWVVQNLENALETWNDKLSEIWKLLTTTPQNFKGGSIWNVMVTINGAVQAIGLALLVLFFVVGVVRTCGSFTDVKKPEHALKLFVRFAIAKGVITYGLELMLALFNIIQGVISTILTSSGFGTPDQTTLPAEMVTTIEDCGFFESIPLWAVTLIGGLFITVLSFIMIMTVYTVKGTIKTLDKAAVAGQKMKQAYIATKDKAERTVNANENTAEEYAADKVEAGMDDISHKAVYVLDRAGRKGVRDTKENLQTAKESVQHFKQQRAERAMNVQKTQHRASAVRNGTTSVPTTQTQTSSAIRTLEKPEKMVKQSVTSAGKKNIKIAGKETAKTTQRAVKTAEHTAKTSIKTIRQAAKTAQKTAQTTAKASKKAAKAAKEAAKQTAQATKTAVKAVVSTVKAIIAGTKVLVSAIAEGGWIAVVIVLVVVLLGSAVAMFGGGSDSNTYTAVSAEVQAYEPVIQKYAKQYGIPEYVELIKAVMMQESGGRGLDPMQAAEGSFNKKYPHEPNGIKDPEYSIECGVQELKAALTSAEVKSPIDMENIKLALQGYNFGNGYISWARSKYGCYSYANAVEFSTQQAQRLGWSSYGDTQYPAHVLRYYPYGRAFTSGSNQAIVEVALTQLGNEGGQPYWSWYGFQSREEWCACFVSWCADQCGYIESGIIPKFAGCVDGANWFKSRNQWHDRNYEPKAGDIIFFDWGGDGATDHVGIVEKCENGTVYTVEGNSGDACKQRTYAVGSSSIYGYGIPAY